VPQTDTNTETGGCMYGEGLLMMSAWRSKHVELYTYRQKITIYHKLHLLVYLLEYMKMHGPGNIKYRTCYVKNCLFVYQNEKHFTKTAVLLCGYLITSNALEQNASDKQVKKCVTAMEHERSLLTNSSVTSLQPKPLWSISSI
jgi:hypothetical protein